ncbi:MAG: glycosyltransferase family 4 protein [Saprospiraceae bacterium]
MKPLPGICLLYLNAFERTGGIEKVNRAILRALADWQAAGQADVHAWSPCERGTDVRYLPADRLRGYAGRRLQFMLDLVWRAPATDILLVSHVNLAPAALLLKLRYPRLRIVVWAHGIEVWRPLGWLKRRLLRQADQILSVSEYTRREIIARHGIAAERIAVHPNCLDPCFQLPTDFGKPAHLLGRYGLQPEQPVLLTLARMNRQEAHKGYDKVLACLPELQQKFPDIVYLLAGECDPTEKKRLEALIDQYGIRQQVIFPGFIPETELTAHYQLANLLVMPSKKEGFGLVFIEAMACGTPALGGNRDGSPEALRPGELGYAVDPEDREALQTAIAEALTLPIEHKVLQEKVLAWASYTCYSSQLWRIFPKNAPHHPRRKPR